MTVFSKMKRMGISLSILLLCVFLGVFLGLCGFTFWYGQGGSYFSNDPDACVNCHIMRDAHSGWQHASHHGSATCNDCHTPHDIVGKYTSKAENGFWHSKGFTLQDFHEPIRIHKKNARILQNNCIDCHKSMIGDLEHYGAFKDGSVKCVHCHRSVGHGSLK